MSELIKPFSIEVASDKKDDKKVTVDFSFFKTDDAKITMPVGEDGQDEAKKRGRPPKHRPEGDGGMYVPADSNGQPTNLPIMQTNEPYINTYNETNYMLKNTLGQIDMLAGEIKTDIDAVRSSKTLKNKYTYITDMTGTTSSLLSTKISAIRELNSTITHAHDLDIKRAKELKLDMSQDQNDDKRIMDMYSAFVNTPVGMYGQVSPLAPPIHEMTMMGGGFDNMIRTDITGGESFDIGMAQYMNNMTPEQNRIRLENNPNIQTVVVFNQDSGQRFFDVIDKSTGQSVPNYPRPDSFLLDNTMIDVNHGVARNTDIEQTYGLVVIGSNGSSKINEY